MANKRQKKKKSKQEPVKERQVDFSADYQEISSYLNPVAQDYYRFILEELKDKNLLSNLDTPLLEQTADAMSKLRECDQILNKEGLLLRQIDRYGHQTVKEHPAVKVKMQYMNQFKALSNQLGMSPSSRASLSDVLKDDDKQTEDPVLTLLKG